MEQFENDYSYPELDELTELIRRMPQPKVKSLNVPRLMQLVRTAERLRRLLEKTGEPVGVELGIDELFNLGSVSVKLDMLTVFEPEEFAALIAPADNFEVYPLTDGTVRLDITFQSVLLGIA